MISDTEYNGWKNYPTWAVNLWLSNDSTTYEGVRNMAFGAVAGAPSTDQVTEGIWTIKEAARFDFADSLKELVEEMTPDLGASFAADLLGYALDQVDWDEIASAWLEGLDTAINEVEA